MAWLVQAGLVSRCGRWQWVTKMGRSWQVRYRIGDGWSDWMYWRAWPTTYRDHRNWVRAGATAVEAVIPQAALDDWHNAVSMTHENAPEIVGPDGSYIYDMGPRRPLVTYEALGE